MMIQKYQLPTRLWSLPSLSHLDYPSFLFCSFGKIRRQSHMKQVLFCSVAQCCVPLHICVCHSQLPTLVTILCSDHTISSLNSPPASLLLLNHREAQRSLPVIIAQCILNGDLCSSVFSKTLSLPVTTAVIFCCCFLAGYNRLLHPACASPLQHV